MKSLSWVKQKKAFSASDYLITIVTLYIGNTKTLIVETSGTPSGGTQYFIHFWGWGLFCLASSCALFFFPFIIRLPLTV